MKPKWLDRRIAAPGPYLTLCLSEAEFLAACAALKLKSPPPWISNPWSDATAHYMENSSGELCAVICLGPREGRSPIEIAGLLVHEAVHVWQEYARTIGETAPGSEQEAYAVQCIAQELMQAYADRIK